MLQAELYLHALNFVKKWENDPEFRIRVLLEEDIKPIPNERLESNLGVRKSPATDTAPSTVRKRPRIKTEDRPLFSPVLNNKLFRKGT